MDWRRTRDDARVTEWEREDGHATVRIRARPDGRWAVRLDVLYQATDGPSYRRVDVDSRETAESRAAAWRTAEGETA